MRFDTRRGFDVVFVAPLKSAFTFFVHTRSTFLRAGWTLAHLGLSCQHSHNTSAFLSSNPDPVCEGCILIRRTKSHPGNSRSIPTRRRGEGANVILSAGVVATLETQAVPGLGSLPFLSRPSLLCPRSVKLVACLPFESAPFLRAETACAYNCMAWKPHRDVGGEAMDLRCRTPTALVVPVAAFCAVVVILSGRSSSSSSPFSSLGKAPILSRRAK